MFPLWLLQVLVIGALGWCGAGVLALIGLLLIDSRDENIW